LIKIRAGRSDDMIECDTKVCFLSEAGDYTALSYTWGRPVERRDIIVDMQPRLVTVNLWRFLWQARQLPERFSGWLWIDALSIDQSDPWEKMEQVKMITKIFGSAESVVVWLGPAYGNSDKAMQALATQVTDMTRWKTPRRLWASPTGPAMLELCERAYWHRLWVYQELKASRTITILCGSRYAQLDALESLLYNNEDERVQAKVQALQYSSAGRMSKLIHGPSATSLETILMSTRYLLCTDPRDRVYAVLNVVSSGHGGIEADYTNPLCDLVNTVFRNMLATREPALLWELASQCTTLEQVFGMSPGSIYRSEDVTSVACHDPLTRLMLSRPDDRLEIPIDLVLQDMFGWCKRQNHPAVAQMLHSEIDSNWNLILELTDDGSESGRQDALESAVVLEVREKVNTVLRSFAEYAA
jgi:hypothetical protein